MLSVDSRKEITNPNLRYSLDVKWKARFDYEQTKYHETSLYYE
jgi:hypothetical protein